MEFKKIAAVCKWRVIAREDHACKACVQQPNGQECSEDNCAPYQFAKTILNEMREDLHNVVKTLVDQIEDKLNNKKLMTDYISKMS
ncbi:MAG: hypothetical protein E3J47_05750 [Candidatus Stahlbacteria bacterium]|nr:MAG: hypothetical protein E3J47_05750 [Candidatus Stahlbacteria bacterium]